jgi:hypothetical protein
MTTTTIYIHIKYNNCKNWQLHNKTYIQKYVILSQLQTTTIYNIYIKKRQLQLFFDNYNYNYNNYKKYRTKETTRTFLTITTNFTITINIEQKTSNYKFLKSGA